MRVVTATLARHSTKDGLVTVWEDVPIGKQYQVDFDSIEIKELIITDSRVPSRHEYHRKETVDDVENGAFLCTELLHIPGHESTVIDSHQDRDGKIWRFEDGLPAEEIKS